MFWLLEDGLVFFVPYCGSHLQLVYRASIPSCTVCPKHLQAQHKIVVKKINYYTSPIMLILMSLDLVCHFSVCPSEFVTIPKARWEISCHPKYFSHYWWPGNGFWPLVITDAVLVCLHSLFNLTSLRVGLFVDKLMYYNFNLILVSY
jgi:hypothetical protein